MGIVTEPKTAAWKVTGLGVFAVALMIATWLAGIAFALTNPATWIGEIVGLPFGVSIYISLVTGLFTIVGALCGAMGCPFFARIPDA